MFEWYPMKKNTEVTVFWIDNFLIQKILQKNL